MSRNSDENHGILGSTNEDILGSTNEYQNQGVFSAGECDLPKLEREKKNVISLDEGQLNKILEHMDFKALADTFKSFFKNMMDIFSKIMSTKNTQSNGNNNNTQINTHSNTKTDNYFNQNEDKKDSLQSGNLNNGENINVELDRNKTLETYEFTDSSIEVSEFLKYRKKPNPKEKRNQKVIREGPKPTESSRKFKFSCNDAKFKVDPKLIFDVKDDPNRKLSKNKFVIDYIRQQFKLVNNTCILALMSKKNLKSGYLAYFKCKFNDCAVFRFKISREGCVEVARSSDIYHAKGEEKVEQMRGPGRFIMKKETKKKELIKLGKIKF